jgi:hypothetical protein
MSFSHINHTALGSATIPFPAPGCPDASLCFTAIGQPSLNITALTRSRRSLAAKINRHPEKKGTRNHESQGV